MGINESVDCYLGPGQIDAVTGQACVISAMTKVHADHKKTNPANLIPSTQWPNLKPSPVFLFIAISLYDRLPSMYTLPVILFCAGIILGGLHGYFWDTTVIDMFFSVAVGGFLGSTVGAAAFTYMYMAKQRAEKREMTDDREGLASVPLSMHPRKALPQHPPQPEKQPPFSLDLPQPEAIPLDDPVKESKAEQIQRLEKEINALKNKKKATDHGNTMVPRPHAGDKRISQTDDSKCRCGSGNTGCQIAHIQRQSPVG